MIKPKFWATLATGTLLGALMAVLQVGPIPFTVGGVLGTVVGGAVFGATLALAIEVMPRMPATLFCTLAIIAGGIAGAAWWALVRPTSSLHVAMLFAAGLALLLVVVEVLFGQAAA
jgi:hypothetical protein